MGERCNEAPRPDFDRKLKLEFHEVKATSDAKRLSFDPAMRHVIGERAKDETVNLVRLLTSYGENYGF
jgi:hypothetical protein